MGDPLPSPPSQPREPERTFRQRSRSPPTGPRARTPPTGPRHHLKVSTTTASHALHSHPNQSSKPEWASHAALATPVQNRMSASHTSNPAPAVLQLPPIPAYRPRPVSGPNFDAEIARVQALRAHITSEYNQTAKASKRARHELEMAAIDLRAAELRRKVADSQLEQARAGALGVDAISTPS